MPLEPTRANYDSTRIPLRHLYFDIFKDVAKQLDIDNGSSLQKNWKTLASLLHFSESDIRGIERQRPRSLTLKVLNEFFVIQPKYTVQDFISILERMGRQDSILIIRRGLMNGLYNTETNIRRSYVNKSKINNGINGNYLTMPTPIPIASRDSSHPNDVPLHSFYEQSDTTGSINFPLHMPPVANISRPRSRKLRTLMVYSHRSYSHAENVLHLADTLRETMGITCVDPYLADEFHTQNCCAFIGSEMEKADWVIFVFDKYYLSDRNFDGEEIPIPEDLGDEPFEYNLAHIRALRFADSMMTNEIYARGMRNHKFIFLLMNNGLPEYIPKICRMFKYFRWPQDQRSLKSVIKPKKKKREKFVNI